MKLQAAFVFCGFWGFVTTQYTGFKNANFGGFVQKSKSLSEFDVQVEQIAEEVAENREVLKKMEGQIKNVQDLVSSLTEHSESQSMEGRPDAAAEVQQSEAKFEARFKTMQKHMDASLDKVDGRVQEVMKLVQEQGKKTQQQCLDAEHQNLAVLLQSIPVPKQFDALVFQTAIASSTMRSELDAHLAIDNNPSPSYTSGSCTHTSETDQSPWWQGTLKTVSEIHSMTLTNRADCCSERLRKFKIECFEDNPEETGDAKPQLCKDVDGILGLKDTIVCDRPVTGKYIRISKYNVEPLTLCEVEATGYTLPKKLILGQSTQSSQSSTDSGAMKARDGNPNTCSKTLNVSGSDPWWQVDIMESKTVTSLRITKSKDGQDSHVSNFEISVFETQPSSCTEVPFTVCNSADVNETQGGVVTFTCDPPVTGRYVRITKKGQSGESLSLCEVTISDATGN